jgi:PilZ domain
VFLWTGFFGTQDASHVLYLSYCPGAAVNRPIGEMNGVGTDSIRRSPRIRLQVPVFVRGTDASGSEFIELTKTLNISAFGACITCQHLLRANQKIHLTIPAPYPISPSFVPNETPPILARVLRMNRMGDIHLFGLEFFHPLE